MAFRHFEWVTGKTPDVGTGPRPGERTHRSQPPVPSSRSAERHVGHMAYM